VRKVCNKINVDVMDFNNNEITRDFYRCRFVRGALCHSGVERLHFAGVSKGISAND
jgi:hypothetical protein